MNVGLADRERFKTCRRAWDFGSPTRQNYEPLPQIDLWAAVQAGLGAYYFPAMWSWNRSLVRPIAHDTFDKAFRAQVAKVGHDDRQAQASGHQLLDAYFNWAAEVDLFTALRASEEFSVVVPDPDHPSEGILAPNGDGVHLTGVVDVVVSDESGRLWAVEHRLVEAFADPAILALEDGPGMLCWALESFYVTKIAGAIINEIQYAGTFRRTQIRKPPKQLAALRRQAAAEVRELVGDRPIYPTPGPACRTCRFVAPCRALAAGQEPSMEGFRLHVPEVIELPPRTGSLGPQVVHGWKTKGPGTAQQY